MQTLIINAHPDFTHRESYSNKLQTLFLEQFKERFPHDEPTILHLHETEIPRIEKDQLLRIWNKQASEQTLTATEEKIAAASSALLAQFKAHHYLKEIFQNLMGFHQFHIVRAQGTAILEEETILTSAADDLSKAFDEFYSPSEM
ncbi:NAD(P)H-dependent oxidoreductase [Bacillus pumilus]|uniref:NAD(P)H-dependent oxidoreductase n=1 Tax=Bacillus pumilus TaxID=1408 RepID=UPI00227EF202|nr:NAD(P)H-dependent oxidoreductase [Bacillus pumilus]MCY7539854.1 NAD(P)H-dependent oxidoreductase [Bacillus pumilus]MEC3590674.1 NAD(P)H-dependent oxidoreductase [Bacillus pumilus]